MSDEPLALPKYVDDPPVILMWTADEVGVFFFLFILGFMLEQVFISLVLGYLVTKTVRRMRNTKPDGYMFHIGYWFGAPVKEARTIPNPFERNYY